MFMRLLQLKINTQYVKEFKKFYEESVLHLLQKTPGCIFAGLIKSNPEENEFISLTFWQTQQNAEDYENSGSFQNLIAEAKPFLSESNEWRVQLTDKMELEYLPVTEDPVIKKYSVEIQKEENEKLKMQDSQMHVRIVSMKIQEDKLEEFKQIYLNKVIPALKETAGCKHIFLTESINDRNEFISVTIWENKQYADKYELSGRFEELISQVRNTFSQFYLWKMSLEKKYNAQIKTTDDIKVETYNMITGKNFL